MTYLLKRQVNQLKEAIIPKRNIDICVKDQQGIYRYNRKEYDTFEELHKATPDIDLMYVVSWKGK